MRRVLQFKFRLVLALVSISFVPMVTVTLLQQAQIDRTVEDLNTRNTAQVNKIVSHYFEDTRRSVLNIARNYAENDELNSEFRSGNRESLDELIRPIFANLNSNNNITVFEYGGVDGIVFTRGHEPGKFGDDKSTNPAVAAALQGEVVSGFIFGSSGLAIRAVLPIISDSQVIGTFQTGFNLSERMLAELGGIIEGDIALYQQDTLNQSSREDQIRAIGIETKPEIYQRLASGEEIIEILSENRIQQIFVPLYDPFGEDVQGMISVSRDLSDVYGNIDQAWQVSLLMIGVGVLIVMLVAFILAGGVVKPINVLKNTMEDISTGDGDLSRQIPVKRQDEFGDLAYHFNSFIAKLNGIVSSIRLHTGEADRRGTQLSTSMDATINSAAEILEASQGIRDRIVDQSETVTGVSSAAEEIARTIENQDSNIQQQTTNVAESSSAIEQMIANIKSISDSLNTSSGEFEQLERVVEDGNRQVDRLSETITSLVQQSERVAEANEIITGIAAQTNLLSMNAAIEAAHAGEFGKGFAVVADEVQKLSEVANEQSSVIAQSLNDLKQMIQSAVGVSAGTGEAFASIVTTVKTVTDIEAQISQSLEEQTAGSAQVLNALSVISQITNEVHTGSTEMRAAIKSILEEIANLVSSTEQIKESALRVTEKAESVNDHVASSAKLLDDTTSTVGEIREEVARFKLSTEG